MSLLEYEMPLPDPLGPIGRAWAKMAHDEPIRTGRLISALEEFLRADSHTNYRVLQDLDKRIDFCIVPPRYVLRGVPDAAVLVRIDHGATKIDIIQVIGEYGGFGESGQWQQIIKTASETI
jgi:hypothetical protein